MSAIYSADMLELVAERGYDHEAHLAALKANNETEIVLTHPANWMTEFEIDVCSTLDALVKEGLIEISNKE